jgi:hypothetical protein
VMSTRACPLSKEMLETYLCIGLRKTIGGGGVREIDE